MIDVIDTSIACSPERPNAIICLNIKARRFDFIDSSNDVYFICHDALRKVAQRHKLITCYSAIDLTI